MSEENSHSNPLADKLRQLPVPDVNDNWNSMRALLDKEMPVIVNDSKRKWLLLLLLLLLVTGVCNCPGLRRGNSISRKGNEDSLFKNLGNNPVNKTSTTSIDNDSMKSSVYGKTGKPENERNARVSDSLNTGVDNLKERKNSADDAGIYQEVQSGSTQKVGTYGAKNLSVTKKNKYKPYIISNVFERKLKAGTNVFAKKEPDSNKQLTDTGSSGIPAINTDTVNIKQDTVAAPANNPLIDSLKNADSLQAKIPVKDSTKKEKSRGFVFAAGLNQFFAIGNQQRSSFNSSGTSGVLADYIPIPQARYHVSTKFYVQLEAQFNTPQYTGKLLARQSLPDSLQPPSALKRYVYIKKLFYFNLPFSVHYSPVKNFYLGTGLQFSQLKNAVGVFEERRTFGNIPDTGAIVKTSNLKSDTAYGLLKTTEWRFLVDANYHWKKFTAGLRYNQAFNYFINARISTQQVTQARNNSLQLYLRYDIWDGRKRR